MCSHMLKEVYSHNVKRAEKKQLEVELYHLLTQLGWVLAHLLPACMKTLNDGVDQDVSQLVHRM